MSAEVPKAWAQCQIGEISRVVGGATPPTRDSANFSDRPGIPWITPADLSGYRKVYISHGTRYLTEKGLAESSAQLLPAGTVLFSSRAPIGYAAIASNALCTNQGFKSFVLSKGIESRFVYYYLKHIKALAEQRATGTTFKELSGSAAAQLPMLIAPTNEQQRIADKLDTILERVGACSDRLERIPVLLKAFRRAVLLTATSGALTEDWRAESGASGDWPLVRLTDVGEIGRGKSKHRPRSDPRLYGGPYPFIQTGDVAQSNGRISSHVQTYNEFGLAQSKLWPAGTVCITIAANIADTAILEYPACFPDSVVGFIADPVRSRPEFIKWSIEVISEQLEASAPATAQKNINLGVLTALTFRCPSIQEQEVIIRRAEALLGYADRLYERYHSARLQIEALTPALLHHAFRGELVPPNPDDEPALLLLQRIHRLALEEPVPKRVRVQKEETVPRAPREKAAMTKSRHDSDVKGQPYLAGMVRAAGGRASAEDLFRLADLPVVDFYKQLAWEVQEGHLCDSETILEIA